MSLAVQGRSAQAISTLLSSCVLLAVLGIQQGNKPDEMMGVGTPSSQSIISGVKIDSIKQKQLDQMTYSPLIQAIDQRDQKWKTYRDTPVTPSVLGTGATFTVTTTNGVITAVAVSGAGSGYTGAAPTLIAIDAAGSCGYGAKLVPTMSAGTFSSVSVVASGGGNGGQGYAATGVTVLVNAGYSAGTMYDRPIFKYAELESTGYVYYRDVDAAVALFKQAVNVNDGPEISVLNTSIQQVLGAQMQEICDALWTGTPSDQSAAMWDRPAGLLAAIDDANTYGGLDRTTAANYWWKAKKDTATHVFSLQDLVNDALYTKGLAFQGGEMQGGPDIFVVNPQLFQKFISQATAQTQVVDLCSNGSLKQFGEYGFKATALKYGQVWCIPDQRCPVGTVLGINSKTIVIAFKSGKKFTPSKIYDGKALGPTTGAFDGSFYYVNTQIMPIVEAPSLCVKYTAVS